MKNIGLKLFSLIVAALLFFYVTSENNTSVIGFSAPIEIKDLPKNKILLWPLSPKAQITIKGPSYLVKQVATTNYILPITVPETLGTRHLAQLNTDNLELPNGVEVLGIDPAELELTFDNKIAKSIPVHISETGNLAEGLILVSKVITPDRVKLIGPEHEIKNISSIATDLLDLSTIKNSSRHNLSLRLPGGFFNAEPTSVSVAFEVSQETVKKVFENLAVELRSNQPILLGLQPAKVKLEISGTKSAVAKLSSNSLLPYVRLIETATIGSKLKVQIETPKDLNVVSIEPSELTLAKTPTKTELVEGNVKSGVNATKSKKSIK